MRAIATSRALWPRRILRRFQIDHSPLSEVLLAAYLPFSRLYREWPGRSRTYSFTSTSVAEARRSLWQEQDFSSKDHCVNLLTFSASTHSFDAISAKGE